MCIVVQKTISKCLASLFLLSFNSVTIAMAAAEHNNASSESVDRNLVGFEGIDEAQPLWEFGAGGVVLDVPNYPASSERNFVALAAPYVVYRGDIFRVGDGNGLRAVVVDKSEFEIDLSFGGAFASDSEDNSARAGMPELDYLFEVGPQIIYKVKDYVFKGGGKARLKARLQARGVFSTDFNRIDHRGFVFEPVLSYQQRGVLFDDSGLNVSFSMTFASEKVHDYFYSVAQEFTTNTRTQYKAQGGYLGSELSMGVSFPIDTNIRAFVGGNAQFHIASANEASPLFEDNITYSIAIGFVWRLYESEASANW